MAGETCRRILSVIVALTACLRAASAGASGPRRPFYIVAHMTNSRAAIDWAAAQGANAMEQDVQFDACGRPHLVAHGGLCDCSCPHHGYFHVCSDVLHNRCYGNHASDDAASHLRHLARVPGLALVVLDNKVKPAWGARLSAAGAHLVTSLERNLFGFGFQGIALISVARISCFEFLLAAAKSASQTANRERYFFTFNEEGAAYSDVVAMLSRVSSNRVFETGRSACLPAMDFAPIIGQAVGGVGKGELGAAFVRTLDTEDEIAKYLGLGVHGIVTNRVALLRSTVALSSGLRLATPSDVLPTATADVESPGRCGCDYHATGGCVVSFPAPGGKACRCEFREPFRCVGSLADCANSTDRCQNPDASLESCRLGGGNCSGYVSVPDCSIRVRRSGSERAGGLMELVMLGAAVSLARWGL